MLQPPRDRARPLPQGNGRPSPEPDWDFGGDEDSEVYTVDTRGRTRTPTRSSQPRRSMPPAGSSPSPRSAAAPRGRPEVSPTRLQPINTPSARTQAPPRPPSRPAQPAKPARPSGPARPPRSRRRPPVALLVLAAVLLWGAFLIFTPIHTWNEVSRIDAAPAGERPAAGSGKTFLLVGSDSRDGFTDAQKEQFGPDDAVGARPDSIILMHVPSGDGKPVMVSIPRDSYMPIPGNGSNKVNAAYAIGGPQLLVETLEQVSGLRIEGYLEIGFGGFTSVVNSLGGVDICVPFDMDDPRAHINLKKGCQNLGGDDALGFVRARYSDPRGDIGRAERQRQFLAAIMKRAATPSTVLNPWRYWSFTHAAAGAIGVGEETSMRDAYSIVSTMRAAGNGDALGLTVPLQSTNYPTRAGSAVKWNTERAQDLFATLRDGTPLTEAPPGTDGIPSG